MTAPRPHVRTPGAESRSRTSGATSRLRPLGKGTPLRAVGATSDVRAFFRRAIQDFYRRRQGTAPAAGVVDEQLDLLAYVLGVRLTGALTAGRPPVDARTRGGGGPASAVPTPAAPAPPATSEPSTPPAPPSTPTPAEAG